ncbi:hypothetical protein ARMA_1842 [Ardenticatena maritima]|uniref:DNA-binding protein n=1 Tax=Ardenticatena maritima TaxID=872965 RepID=A0A0M8K9V5_9CHLR|nr:LOG family protein [Ardenticatena maritima]KPL88433.1 hypothetical protein SE16_06430 [Ardenticatena maritima]GAP63419.1 hypothetical protein ARMA_1842 [Ardenticatena maritima]
MTNERTRPLIAVYGSAQPQPGDELYEEAYRLGRLLAEAGFDVMSGGYYGTMAAVSRGAHEGGGRVVGVTMAIFDPRPPNEWVHETTHTPGFPERLRTLTEMADAYIALRGGIGTLTEVAYTWGLMQTGAMRPKPFILLGAPWRRLLALLQEDDFRIAPHHYNLLTVIEDVDAAVQHLRDQLGV